MKCPDCGIDNRGLVYRCIKCGKILNSPERPGNPGPSGLPRDAENGPGKMRYSPTKVGKTTLKSVGPGKRGGRGVSSLRDEIKMPGKGVISPRRGTQLAIMPQRGTLYAIMQKRAGFIIRTFAMGLDIFFILMLMGVLLAGIAIFIGETTDIVAGTLKSNRIGYLKEFIPYFKQMGLLLLVIPPLYFILMHAIFGQTIGKMIMGIKVLRADGRPVSLFIATIRFIGYIISGVLLTFGFLWVIWDREKQGWHDMISDTIVIKM